jgi:CHRD domain-containing protein
MTAARALILSSLAVLLGCATEKAAAPAPKTYDVALTPGAEVPVCPAAAQGGQGRATVAVAPDDSSITVTVTYSGLSGDLTAAHLHAGAAGVSGPVVLPFSGPFSSPFSKTFTAADYVAAPNAPPDFASFLTMLKSGGAYINLHTAACKPGEIRGQIQ